MNGESSSYDKLESMSQGGSSEPHNVPLKYLRNITNNFSYERQLGEGGFGTVYKGVLQNGEMIAVKRFKSSVPGVRDRQFENEAKHLMRLEHPNVVLLVGWCSEIEYTYTEYKGKDVWAESSETLLCLEYMPKGNLRGYLSDECSGLGWDTRYKIIEGICYGLRYLHEECQINAPIVHMDLKPANILLDNNMVPKIADFGLSRLFSQAKTSTCTRSRVGSLGYMSPEYIKKGLISKKSDIFSLGVIIIEIVTGRRDYPDDTRTPSEEFVETVLHNWSQRMGIKTLFGVSLEVDYQQIRRCIQIGLDCVKTDRSKRPTISQIIKTLHGPETADSSNIKGVHGPQSGERERNCGTSWMERLTKKHTPGCSIIETFTVSLHQWQKKTALRRIRAIFTAVVFVVLLKERATAEPAVASDSDSASASASASDSDAASASDSDADAASASDADADYAVRAVADVLRGHVPDVRGQVADALRGPVPDVRGQVADALGGLVADALRGHVADALHGTIADVLRGRVADAFHGRAAASLTSAATASFTIASAQAFAHTLADHVVAASTVAHRIAFAAASTVAFGVAAMVASQMQSTTTDVDVIRVRDVVLDRVLEALRPLVKVVAHHVAACAAVSDADRIASRTRLPDSDLDSDADADSASPSASDSDSDADSDSDSDSVSRTRPRSWKRPMTSRTQPADVSRTRPRSRKRPMTSRTRPADMSQTRPRSRKRPADASRSRKRSRKG